MDNDPMMGGHGGRAGDLGANLMERGRFNSK